MTEVTVDREHCLGCGKCLAVCPERRIVMKDGRAYLQGQQCMECGHCRAACPEGAIHISSLQDDLGLETVSGSEGLIVPGDYDCGRLVQLMRSRRSCRNYREETVSLAVLHDLVKIGITAPSGTNSQGWNFTILPTRSDVEALGALTARFYRRLNRLARNPVLRFLASMVGQHSLAGYYRRYYASVEQALDDWQQRGCDRLFHGAVAAIIVSGTQESSCPAEDCLLASENILLAAHAMGLGSCLIGFVVEAMARDGRIGKALDLPGGDKVYSVIGLGYPAEIYCRPAGRKDVVPRVVSLAE